MNRGAVGYGFRLFVQKILGLLCILRGANWVVSWQAWAYFGVGFILTAISLAIMFRVNPETLARRGQVATDSPWWDKMLLSSYWLLNFFGIYYLAGTGMGATLAAPFLFWIGMALGLISGFLAIAALVANTFLESTVRIQVERGQQVVSAGPYGLVRHPTYLSGLLQGLSTCLVFPTLGVVICAVVIALILVVRTELEDRLLKRALPGYVEYSGKTAYKLIPFVW